MKKNLYLMLLMVFCLNSLKAQSIFTDRPTVATSPSTLPVNWFQIETGFQYQIRDAQLIGNLAPGLKFESILYNGLLLRHGITDNFEIRFNQSVSQNRFRLDGETTSDDGVDLTPTSIGFKWRLLKDVKNWPDIAIMANYGNSIFTDNGAGAVLDMTLLFNSTLFKEFNLDYNLGLILENELSLSIITYSMVLSKQLNQKMSAYFEFYGSDNVDINPTFNIDVGLTYILSDTMQVDLYGGTGFTDLSPNVMFGFGFSKLFMPKNETSK